MSGKLQPFNAQFYGKVAALSFVFGAGIELFMIKTGFYDIVTRLETERRLENLEAQRQYKELQGKVPMNWPGKEKQDN